MSGSMDLFKFPGEFNLLFPLLLVPLIFLIFKNILLKKPPLPPGPYPWPIIGNIFQMGKNPFLTLTNLARIHGPLMSLRLGNQLLVVGSSPVAAMEILKTHDRALSGRCVVHTHPLWSPELNHLAIGSASECNDQWKYLRAISRAELFSGKAMESQAQLREKKVTEMVRYLNAKEGQLVNMSDIIFTTVFNSLSNVLFSRDSADFEGKGVGGELKELLSRFGEVGAVPNIADFYPLLGRFDIQGLRKKAIEICGEIFNIWEDIIKERRKQRIEGISSPQDFLDALIDKQFSDDHINHLLLEMVTAGTETTSSVSEWAMADLIKNQEAMEKLRDELARNVGGDVIAGGSQLPHLPYLQACIKESMRLHPPGPFLLPHRAIETCQVMNYTVPKDSQVIVNTLAIAQDPAIWSDPLSFKPERFLTSGLDFKGSDFEFVPFGSGRRMCPGVPMAARQIPLILASLVQLFDWFLPDNKDPAELDMNEKFSIVLHKEQPLQLVPKIRKIS